jgi:stage II sporulation protein AA (anti-sigma F factor antagonist)
MAEANADGLLEQEMRGDVTVVRIKEPMLRGDSTTDDVFSRLYGLVAGGAHPKVVLNLGAIEYFASVALGKLVALYHKAQAAGARLALCEVTPTVDRVLHMTHLADLLPVYQDEREAVSALA